MKLSAEDYRSHYRALSDEELLAIDPDELVDLARRCLQAELDRRHLQHEETADEPETDEEPAVRRPQPASNEPMLQIALATDQRSAMNLQRVLLDANVPAEITTEPALPGAYAQGMFGLLVAASCADDARELIAGPLTWDNQALVRRWLEQEWTPEDMDVKDLEVNVDDYFGEENKVAVRLTVRGADPDTGRPIELGGIAIVQVADGKISERWIKLDSVPPS